MVAAMVTVAACHRSLIQPYLWLVATYLLQKGSQRFYGRIIVGQPAAASQASQPVITSNNYHTIVVNHTKMFK